MRRTSYRDYKANPLNSRETSRIANNKKVKKLGEPQLNRIFFRFLKEQHKGEEAKYSREFFSRLTRISDDLDLKISDSDLSFCDWLDAVCQSRAPFKIQKQLRPIAKQDTWLGDLHEARVGMVLAQLKDEGVIEDFCTVSDNFVTDTYNRHYAKRYNHLFHTLDNAGIDFLIRIKSKSGYHYLPLQVKGGFTFQKFIHLFVPKANIEELENLPERASEQVFKGNGFQVYALRNINCIYDVNQCKLFEIKKKITNFVKKPKSFPILKLKKDFRRYKQFELLNLLFEAGVVQYNPINQRIKRLIRERGSEIDSGNTTRLLLKEIARILDIDASSQHNLNEISNALAKVKRGKVKLGDDYLFYSGLVDQIGKEVPSDNPINKYIAYLNDTLRSFVRNIHYLRNDYKVYNWLSYLFDPRVISSKFIKVIGDIRSHGRIENFRKTSFIFHRVALALAKLYEQGDIKDFKFASRYPLRVIYEDSLNDLPKAYEPLLAYSELEPDFMVGVDDNGKTKYLPFFVDEAHDHLADNLTSTIGIDPESRGYLRAKYANDAQISGLDGCEYVTVKKTYPVLKSLQCKDSISNISKALKDFIGANVRDGETLDESDLQVIKPISNLMSLKKKNLVEFTAAA